MSTGGKPLCKRGHEYDDPTTYKFHGYRLCRRCRNLKAKEFRSRNQKRVNDWHKENYQNNSMSIKESKRIYRQLKRDKDAQYNLQVPYLEMYKEQSGLCAICRRPDATKGRALSVDHDHSCCPSGTSCGTCVRELLCGHCNKALGLVADSKETLQAMINYLDKHSNKGTL